MTTAVFAKAGLMADQVRAEARQLDPARVLLTLLMVPFVVVGWLSGKTVAAVWFVASFAWTAAVVGWRMARGEGEDSS